MKKEHLTFIFCIFISQLLHAQTVADTTIYFPAVNFESTKARHSAGMVVSTIDSSTSVLYKFHSVAELISQQTFINVRNYGPGLLSTINARGLGANHTSILWNGIPLNSSNLGLTDLSLLPSFLFNEIAIVSGGSGSVYGNNTMGIAIELMNSEPVTTDITIAGNVGSFEQYASQIQFNYSGKKIKSSTGVYIANAHNDFIFKNITKPGGPIQKQNNAMQSNKGIIQTITYNVDNYNILRGGIWYQYSEREIPPLMTMDRSREVQRDSSFRVFGEWRKTFSNILLRNRTSYTNEFIFYNNYLNGINGKSDVKNYRNEIELKYYPGKKINIISSLTGNISKADIKEYEEIKNSNIFGISINAKYLLKPDWFIGVGFKKEFSGLFKSPYAFSAGIDGEIFENKLFLAANISQIYSLPTLNDLYWNPGGNENLLPEKGINSQLNIKWNFFKSSLISITGFYSYIDDWIQWLPNSSGNFSPVNIKQVESNGIEASLKQEILWRNWKLNFSGNYGFTNTINTSFEGNGELVNKQLIYVPNQIFNTTALLYYKNTGVYSIWEFTGERFTTADNTRSLDPYSILNLGAIINYKYDLFLFTIKPEIKNLLNTSYQPIPWRAMPGRSYFLTINLNLNFKKN